MAGAESNGVFKVGRTSLVAKAPGRLAALTPHLVMHQIAAFDDKHANTEKAVSLLFTQWPRNTDLAQVLLKVIVLNQLYRTRILDVRAVAEHIVRCDIDLSLKAGDPELVNRVAKIDLGGKWRFFLSFATKYCSWHEPSRFQIYDSRVECVLWRYRHHLCLKVKRADLRDYPTFLTIVQAFVEHFGLEQFSAKQIDKFFWMEGSGPSVVISP